MKLTLLPLATLCLVACQSTHHQHSASSNPSPEEMMQAMMRVGTPGAEHRLLDPLVGTWDAQVTMWMDPAMPPEVSTGRMVNAWVLDGRYLEERYSGDFGDKPFEGRGTLGYDIGAQEFIGTWMDSMSTAISHSTGEASADGKAFRMKATFTDPMTGKPVVSDQLITIDGPNKHTMAMFEDRGGKQVKTMEIVYTRAR